jgi:hypothetical protein
VFQPNAELLCAPEIEPNSFIRNCGLDRQGKYVWCTSLSRLWVFNLSPPCRILNTELPKWPVTEIYQDNNQIQVETSQAKYLYSSSGELLNRVDVEVVSEKYIVSTGNAKDLLAIANQHFQLTAPEEMSSAEKRFVVDVLHRAVEIASPRTHERARSNRMLGEIALACGDKAKALLHFKAALADDPKIGVAALAKRLERETRTGR